MTHKEIEEFLMLRSLKFEGRSVEQEIIYRKRYTSARAEATPFLCMESLVYLEDLKELFSGHSGVVITITPSSETEEQEHTDEWIAEWGKNQSRALAINFSRRESVSVKDVELILETLEEDPIPMSIFSAIKFLSKLPGSREVNIQGPFSRKDLPSASELDNIGGSYGSNYVPKFKSGKEEKKKEEPTPLPPRAVAAVEPEQKPKKEKKQEPTGEFNPFLYCFPVNPDGYKPENDPQYTNLDRFAFDDLLCKHYPGGFKYVPYKDQNGNGPSLAFLFDRGFDLRLLNWMNGMSDEDKAQTLKYWDSTWDKFYDKTELPDPRPHGDDDPIPKIDGQEDPEGMDDKESPGKKKKGDDDDGPEMDMARL